MKVVFDTNVLISAFIFPGGAPEAAFRLVLEGHVELITTPPLLSELARVLTDKFGWDVSRAQEAVGLVIRAATVVTPTRAIAEILEDPSDDRVLEAAQEGAVDLIVSGDKHLLKLRTWEGVRIVDPSALKDEFGQLP